MSEETPTGPGATSRRALLMGVGAVGASTVLAACGTDDDGADATGSDKQDGGATDGGSGGETGGGGQRVGAASAIQVGGGAVFADQGVVVTQPAQGTFKGFDNICTHMRCPLANVDGGTINCTCHGSKFSIEDGSVKSGPATEPLPEKAITLDGDDILLA